MAEHPWGGHRCRCRKPIPVTGLDGKVNCIRCKGRAAKRKGRKR